MKKKLVIQIGLIIQTLIAVYLLFNIIFNFNEFFETSRSNEKTMITFIFLIVMIQIIIYIAYFFKEKAVKKILIICASSSAFIVILIVAFIANEGIPAFTQNNPVEFITGTVFQPFYQGASQSKQNILTTVQPDTITQNDTFISSVIPTYNIIFIPRSEPGRFSTEYLFINPTNTSINVSIVVESPDYFNPSFDEIPWEYTTKTGSVTLNANQTKRLTFRPRMITLIEGTHYINMTIFFTDEIIETTTLELRYQRTDLLTIEEISKTVEHNKTVIYPMKFQGFESTNYTIRIQDISPGWIYELKYNNQTILTNVNSIYQFSPLNRTMLFHLYVTPPVNADIGDFDQIELSVKDPGSKPTFGVLPFIIGTILTALIAIVIAAPIGLGCSILLSEYMPRKIRFYLKSLFELLAGIPSVIYGLWGFITFGPLLGNTLWPFVANTLGTFIPFLSPTNFMQAATFTAGIVLSIMILPIIITLSEDAIQSVPRKLREGSLALGATRWQTIRKIVLPCSKSGIISGIILGLGRAIGETMAVLMIMTYVSSMPTSLLGPSGSMTGVIATLLGSTFSFDLTRQALFGIALLLFMMIFILNVIIFFIIKERKYSEKRSIFSLFKIIGSKASLFLLLIPTITKDNIAKVGNNKKFTIISEDIVNKEVSDMKKQDLTSKQKKFMILDEEVIEPITQKEPSDYVKKKTQHRFHHLIHPKKMEKIMIALLITGAGFALFMLLWILGDVLVKGIPSLQLMFFLEREIGLGVEGGFLNAIIGSLQLVGLALLIAAPLAIGAAIYVQEYAKQNNPFTRVILFTSDTLASTPSIVFGGFGFLFFVVYLNFGYSVLAGGFTLAFMILPILLRSSIEAIKAIPREFYEGALALGATKWQAIKTVILPPARPGIVSGVILGIGRSIGETAAVMFTAGYSAHIATSILHPAGSLPNMIYKYYSLGFQFPTLMDKVYSVAIVLIIVVLILNTISKLSYLKSSKLIDA